MDFTKPTINAAAAERLPGAGPMPVVMNWEERARRAEALAGRLYEALEDCHATLRDIINGADMRIYRSSEYDAAADAWTSHRADLDTLEQEAAR